MGSVTSAPVWVVCLGLVLIKTIGLYPWLSPTYITKHFTVQMDVAGKSGYFATAAQGWFLMEHQQQLEELRKCFSRLVTTILPDLLNPATP